MDTKVKWNCRHGRNKGFFGFFSITCIIKKKLLIPRVNTINTKVFYRQCSHYIYIMDFFSAIAYGGFFLNCWDGGKRV